MDPITLPPRGRAKTRVVIALLIASSLSLIVALPGVAAQAEDCGSFPAVGSFRYGGGDWWGSAGSLYVPCDSDGGGDDYSMGGSVVYGCESGGECDESEPTGAWGINNGGYCGVTWSSGGTQESQDGGSITYDQTDGVHSMTGDCSVGFDAVMTTHGASAFLLSLLEDL